MLRTRVIPVLLISDRKLVKTVKFKKPVYVGDPINTIKIFNDKEVDEIAVLDINASRLKRQPDYEYIESLASQCFMPLAYGGGVTDSIQAQRILELGVEKIILNTSAINDMDVVSSISEQAGSQSVVVSIDVKKNWLGKYEVVISGGKKKTGLKPADCIVKAVEHGAGEILINSVDKDGTLSGYDTELISEISSLVDVPIIACGGARNIDDFKLALDSGATAVAAGSMFVFTGPHRAVLISYPKYTDLQEKLA